MQPLFSEFKPGTPAEWKAQLIKDLKGEAYEGLVWHNENGFDIQPFYTTGEAQKYAPVFSHTDWEICVNADGSDAASINKQLLRSLRGGATSISWRCDVLEPASVLRDIQLNHIHSVFTVNNNNAEKLIVYLEKLYDLKAVQTSLFHESFKNAGNLAFFRQVIGQLKAFKGMASVTVDALPHHNQGCYAAYEIALVFLMLVELLEGLPPNEIPSSPFAIRTGVDTDYFTQIAKLRAMRRVWNVLRKEYGITNELYIIAETSLTTKSLGDAYNNLLRTTVEAMGAVAGGCNELVVTPFDTWSTTHSRLAERMAVNQQLILKDESYLDKIADIGCGSFYIESLTDNLASMALETFKRMEVAGGYFKCLEAGTITKEIASQAAARAEAVRSQQQVVVGVNKFKNEKEKVTLDAADIDRLQHTQVNNPVLNYELDLMKLKNA